MAEGKIGIGAIKSGNTIPVKHFTMTAEKLITDGPLVVTGVRKIYQTDADGNRTDNVIAICYDTIDADYYSSPTIKVESSKAVVSADELEASDSPILIKIPVTQTLVKPYCISYGMVKASIVAPYVERVETDTNKKI